MTTLLFVDDEEWRHEVVRRCVIGTGIQVTHVWSAAEAIAALKDSTFDLISLDHDMAAEHYKAGGDTMEDDAAYDLWVKSQNVTGTGDDVARYIANDLTVRQLTVRQVNLHSMNPAGRQRMLQSLTAGGRQPYLVSLEVFPNLEWLSFYHAVAAD